MTTGPTAMPFKLFTIPIRDNGSAAELNSFLQSHRILAVDRRWVDQGTDSFWAIRLDSLSGSSDSTTAKSNLSRDCIHDEQDLPPEEFPISSKLLDLRKELVLQKAVSVYDLFTKKQLAQLPKR
jgi:hypothetical protein